MSNYENENDMYEIMLYVLTNIIRTLTKDERCHFEIQRRLWIGNDNEDEYGKLLFESHADILNDVCELIDNISKVKQLEK